MTRIAQVRRRAVLQATLGTGIERDAEMSTARDYLSQPCKTQELWWKRQVACRPASARASTKLVWSTPWLDTLTVDSFASEQGRAGLTEPKPSAPRHRDAKRSRALGCRKVTREYSCASPAPKARPAQRALRVLGRSTDQVVRFR
jgi:hypothetical protein